MTVDLNTDSIVSLIPDELTSSVIQASGNQMTVEASRLSDIAVFLKAKSGLELDYLCSITGFDYPGYLEVEYLFYSLKLNHRFRLKVRCDDKVNPQIPSLATHWAGAELQEREVFDLLGITFTDHPNLKRIFLWEGFEGYPLRKDFGCGD